MSANVMPAVIVNYAGSWLNKKGLGNGQCTELVHAALAVVGAKPGSNYVWGRALNAGEGTQPGDVIQFTRVVIQDRGTWTLGIPNHTAIVAAVSGSKVTLFHQNVDGQPAVLKSHVRSQTFDFAKRVSGSYIVYRPVPK